MAKRTSLHQTTTVILPTLLCSVDYVVGDMSELTTLAETATPPKSQKQNEAKEKVRKYFDQLTKGCGDPECGSDCCASSPACAWPFVSTNQAAKVAIELLKHGASLCPPYDPTYLTEAKLSAVASRCERDGDWSPLAAYFTGAMSSVDVLCKSFPRPRYRPGSGPWDGGGSGGGGSAVAASAADGPIDDDRCCFDVDAAGRSFAAVFSVDDRGFHAAVCACLVGLSAGMTKDLQEGQRLDAWLATTLVLLEIPCLHAPEYMEQAYPALLRAASWLPIGTQVRLVRLLSRYGAERLQRVLQQLQQLVTFRVVVGEWSNEHAINGDAAITSAVQMMSNVYYASLLGGVCDSKELLDAEAAYAAKAAGSQRERDRTGAAGASAGGAFRSKPSEKISRLEKVLGLRPVDCRVPLLSADEFVNQLINDKIEMDRDLIYHKSGDGLHFAFLSYPFVLSTATKSLAMFYDNRLRMISERRAAIVRTLLYSDISLPYLRLLVRRDHIVDDALNGLEMVYTDDPADLRKQLYVEFEGEQGIDEGGVSKEFFQLMVEELFNPDFGMFVYNEETHTFWLNHGSFENEAQFTLVGILLGLAIYNNVVLDVHFPMVVYRKLLGKLGTLDDLADSHPVLFRSLKQLLEHDGNVEEDLMMTFSVSYQNVYGGVEVHALKDEGGGELPVTNSNREEFVALYADHLLNKLVETQFAAFARGFQMVVDESPLQQLFLPAEVELLVCGSRDWDFGALQEGCEYDGGYAADTPIIRDFWDIVHGMSDAEKRLLLQFTTGSDRVPVGGLARLRLIITRHGPDTNRLPTAHTCFNVLLLPEYGSREKLRERLLVAITHAKGFGML